jgi:hypothetical protein
VPWVRAQVVKSLAVTFDLAVAHIVVDDENVEGYDQTHYGWALVLAVPNRAFNESRSK